jgi:SPP1 family predicted phage head-tail adaptor
MAVEINAGELDRRVTLYRPMYGTYEDEIVGWEPVAEVWAAVNPELATGGAREGTEAARTVASKSIPIVIRYRNDIDARWRIEDGDARYEVRGMLDVARRHVQLQLTCEEIQ